MKTGMCPWSDNWWIEGDKAWFCGGQIGALFCVDMNTQQCKLIAWIPECNFLHFRVYSYCIKFSNKVFCLPSKGKCSWVYDIDKRTWQKLEIDNLDQVRVCLFTYEKSNRQVYLLDKTGELFEIDLEKLRIAKIWDFLPCTEIPKYERIDNCLYCVRDKQIICLSRKGNVINHIAYEIPEVQSELSTVCYDGTNFWLSGYCKEIYIWNPEQGVIKVIKDFPSQFGFYNFCKGEEPVSDCISFLNGECTFFEESILLGKYVWFIPSRSDDIIYIDKVTYEVFLLEIEGEKETKESIQNHLMNYKYILLYIYINRYIGLYSLRNRRFFEIDTVELCVKYRHYGLSEESIKSIGKFVANSNDEKIFSETKEMDRAVYSYLIKNDFNKESIVFQNIGEAIHKSVCMD